MPSLIIDIATADVNKLVARLARLKTTQHVQDGGAYREDIYYSQVLLDTSKTEAEVDMWLYSMKKPLECVGVCTVKGSV
tara:strand:- start:339 stop:575 length:237 start_codon:yes stop_codon:yes gene_type:complete